MLVKISPETISGFNYSQLKHGNADIAFVSMDGGTEYPFEIDTWDTSGTSFVWVKLPELTAATQFKFLWGDESVTTSAANAHAVWGSAADGSYLGVWHMNGGDGADESDSAGTVTDVDMTFAAKAGTGGDTSRMTSVAAMIGTGRSIDSSNKAVANGNYFLCSDFANAGLGTKFTVSYWECPTVAGVWNDIVTRQPTSQSGDEWRIRRLRLDTQYFCYKASSGRNTSYAFKVGEWNNILVAVDGNKLNLFINGERKVTQNSDGSVKDVGALAICNNTDGTTTSSGSELDEIRILKGSFASVDWAKAEYDTVATAGFLVYGAAATKSVRQLIVTAVPDEIGAVSPAFGKYGNLAEGEEKVCTAPVGEFNVEERKYARFIGWKYYELDKDGFYQLKKSGDTLSFTYRQVGDVSAKLEWQLAYRWTADVSISIPGEDEGKGTATGAGSHTVGEEVTVTAIPKDGETFYYWEGDLPEGAASSSPTLTFVLGENGASFVPHFTGRTVRWKAPVKGNWNDAASWEGDEVPPNDGSVDVVFPGCATSYAVTPNTYNNIYVRSIHIEDSPSAVAVGSRNGPTFEGNSSQIIHIGAGGFSHGTKVGNNNPYFRCSVEIACSQTWDLSNEWTPQTIQTRTWFVGSLFVPEDVVWTITGASGINFANGTDFTQVRGTIRSNSWLASTPDRNNAKQVFASDMKKFEWSNTAALGQRPGATGSEKTYLDIAAAPETSPTADFEIDFTDTAASATLCFPGMTHNKVCLGLVTNKWSGNVDIPLTISSGDDGSGVPRFIGKQGVRFGNPASTLRFRGASPKVMVNSVSMTILDSNTFGPDNGVFFEMYTAHNGGAQLGLFGGDGVTISGDIKHHQGLYSDLFVGTLDENANVVYNGVLSQTSANYGIVFAAGKGSVARFNGEIKVAGSDVYQAQKDRYPVAVYGEGDVVFTHDNASIAWPEVRGGNLVLASEKAAGKDTVAISLGGRVPDVIDVRCVRYSDSSTGSAKVQTIDGKTVINNGGNPFVFDGVTLEVGDRVLSTCILNATYDKASECGVYEVTAVDQLTRISDEWYPDREDYWGWGLRIHVAEGANFGGTTWMMSGCGFSAPLFALEPVANEPEVGVFTEGAVFIANPIRVTDNKSAGRSVIGGRTVDASGFTGAITLEKDVTFEAAAGGTVTVSGAIADAEGTGTHRLYVDGPGKVVFNTDVAGRTIDFSRVSEAELESSGFSSVTLASGLAGATVVLPDASSFEMWRVYTRNGRVRASRNGFTVLVR